MVLASPKGHCWIPNASGADTYAAAAIANVGLVVVAGANVIVEAKETGAKTKDRERGRGERGRGSLSTDSFLWVQTRNHPPNAKITESLLCTDLFSCLLHPTHTRSTLGAILGATGQDGGWHPIRSPAARL